jgi:hypothetical protein
MEREETNTPIFLSTVSYAEPVDQSADNPVPLDGKTPFDTQNSFHQL